QELGDRCGLTRRHSLYLASTEKDVEQLRGECDARRSMNIDVNFMSRELLHEMLGFSRPGALWSTLAFDVDPYRLTLKLIQKSVERGLEVFTSTPIVRCSADAGGMTLHS